ncbi:class I SAM-dependent DNA methyltransferase [Agromyces sp. Leaf222]|uniref:HsdM family class I SAM-dependent methyltransferase n=1 Tax=Agromyces sp. Leaf222 TaxID=1735688 RepID=UPI0006F5F0BF|nr:N-6 DNA methylase [Agromyces sp. Leaf222]KQM84628.1 restriction endonuclease [Agromyces sp. Leaf222]
MANERITEDMVGDRMRELGYYEDEQGILVEKQQSVNVAIRSALSKASKKGTGKSAGYPEFIVTAPATPDIVVLVECKADISKHESDNLDRPVDYAVDGVLHYARHLSAMYTVVAIAVSGTPQASQSSFFLIPKGSSEHRRLVAPTGADIDELVPLSDLIAAASFDPTVQRQRERDLIQFSQELHVFMRDEAEMTEQEKPLAVAGTLIALRDQVFADTYQAYPAKDLPSAWMDAIRRQMTDKELPKAKVANLVQPFTTIQVQPELGKATTAYPKGLLNQIVTMLAEHVLPFMTIYHDFDVVGQFYGEFLRYTGGDGKGLGIVLTPRHVTELFALIANVNRHSVVVDPCAGTGGFLISAMMQMTKTATTDAEIASIKAERLVGIEQQPTMYALAASNMILRGDGKANLYQGSCFDSPNIAAVKKHKGLDGKPMQPTVGLINPPYAKSKQDLSELRFVRNMLDMLAEGGIGVAIVPVSCATAPSGEKNELLKHHTLEAVMSMPPEVFSPVGVVTCIMVYTAHKPHKVSDRKTWFGYWRNDGFVKVKNLGRVDKNHAWAQIRDRWIESWRNREVHAGESVMHKVTATDEWVAEAYMETDYSTLTEEDFERVLLDYALFTLGHGDNAEDEE